MEKSKLGISINLFAALLFFIGAAGGSFSIVIAAGYVLLLEQSLNLKKTAVQALILTILFGILSVAITWLTNPLSYFLSSLNYYRYNNDGTLNYIYHYLNNLPYILNIIVRGIGDVILIILGFRAYKGKEIKIKWIDNILEKHLNKE